MRRKILMGVLALGVVVGFGSEIRRAAWRYQGGCGSSCADYDQKSSQSFSAATPAVETQTPQTEHKKGEHCDGWKSRWNWSDHQEKAPEAPITTAQNQ